jgi:hypothetical protein
METKRNKWTVLSALFLSTIVLFAFARKTAEVATIDLSTAIAQGKVFSEMKANGNFNGQSVQLNLRNNTSVGLKIRIPAGTVFDPPSEDDQDLIMVEDDFIVLQPKSQANTVLDAYCMQASNHAPEENGKMKMIKNTNTDLDKLVVYLKTHKVSKDVFQDAVWALSNGYAISSVNITTPADKELRNYLATLTGRSNVWYSTPQVRTVEPDRNIRQETVVVKGDITYNAAKGAMVYQEIVAADGRSIHKSDKMATPYGGKVDFSFTLKVRGWEKGDYAVVVKEGTKELANYPFSI